MSQIAVLFVFGRRYKKQMFESMWPKMSQGLLNWAGPPRNFMNPSLGFDF